MKGGLSCFQRALRKMPPALTINIIREGPEVRCREEMLEVSPKLSAEPRLTGCNNEVVDIHIQDRFNPFSVETRRPKNRLII